MLDAARANNLLLESIAKDSREQAASIEEVNTSVRQLDEMTQHNASLVEETNAAIAQTDLQAGELDKIVGLFSIDAAPVALAPVRRTVRAEAASAAPAKPAGLASAAGGIKGLQARVRTAAKAYLGKGGAATAEDWSEF
jgi:methyl-accepting chemotaxis protein